MCNTCDECGGRYNERAQRTDHLRTCSRHMHADSIYKTEIREYDEGHVVLIVERERGGYDIEALNEGGLNGVSIDLGDVLDWVKANKPELLGDTNA